jgi:2-methylfumaryl-CoA isomerase
MPTVFNGGHFAGEPAPRLGGDTADVLATSLGLTAADITRLTDAKTIAC